MMPFSIASRIPFSTEGMYSFGMAPPRIAFSQTKPPPGGIGSTRMETSANWPRPPVWRANRVRCSIFFEIVSL